MKKTLILLSCATICALMFIGCTSKPCYCYDYGITVTEELTYAYDDASCASLSRGVEGAPGSRVCVEQNERMDPSMLANK